MLISLKQSFLGLAMSINNEFKTLATSAGILALDILQNDFHRPVVNKKCNRDNIEEAITVGILAHDLGPIRWEEVKLAMDLIDDLLENGISNDQT